jgi:ubiquitin carboxyl-terminal hydrolase 8
MAREGRRLPTERRRTYESRPLSKEEERKWDETLRDEANAESPTIVRDDTTEDAFYVRTTEDFFRRFPEVPAIQESMVSPSYGSVGHQLTSVAHDELSSMLPATPARPPPAVPRQTFSGVSEKTGGTQYQMTKPPVPGSHPQVDTITPTVATPGLTGLTNFNNTCYMNSTLQCLSATTAIASFLSGYNFPSQQPPRKPGEVSDPPQLLVRNFGNLLRHLWSGNYNYVTPKTFRVRIF